jgi:hypothetical protein
MRQAIEPKKGGIVLVSIAVMLMAFQSGMPWWEAVLVVGLTFWGLYLLAGMKAHWW